MNFTSRLLSGMEDGRRFYSTFYLAHPPQYRRERHAQLTDIVRFLVNCKSSHDSCPAKYDAIHPFQNGDKTHQRLF